MEADVQGQPSLFSVALAGRAVHRHPAGSWEVVVVDDDPAAVDATADAGRGRKDRAGGTRRDRKRAGHGAGRELQRSNVPGVTEDQDMLW